MKSLQTGLLAAISREKNEKVFFFLKNNNSKENINIKKKKAKEKFSSLSCNISSTAGAIFVFLQQCLLSRCTFCCRRGGIKKHFSTFTQAKMHKSQWVCVCVCVWSQRIAPPPKTPTHTIRQQKQKKRPREFFIIIIIWVPHFCFVSPFARLPLGQRWKDRMLYRVRESRWKFNV